MANKERKVWPIIRAARGIKGDLVSPTLKIPPNLPLPKGGIHRMARREIIN